MSEKFQKALFLLRRPELFSNIITDANGHINPVYVLF